MSFDASSLVDNDDIKDTKAKQLANLFLVTTVVYADISWFSAWSSVREPSQVFTLLETLYKPFDKAPIARGVFKVQTIGDWYFAASDIAKLQKDHALRSLHFAKDIMHRMDVLM